MPNISEIISTLDKHLALTRKQHIDPVEGNRILEKEGLLNNSVGRPGSPLRGLLRKGLLPHALQKSGKGSSWIIPHSSKKTNVIYNYKAGAVESIKYKTAIKGKNTFTVPEANAIRQLIKEKLRTTPDKQKGIREKIRDIGFYFSKYDTKGYCYNLIGFEALISSGQIRINKC